MIDKESFIRLFLKNCKQICTTLENVSIKTTQKNNRAMKNLFCLSNEISKNASDAIEAFSFLLVYPDNRVRINAAANALRLNYLVFESVQILKEIKENKNPDENLLAGNANLTLVAWQEQNRMINLNSTEIIESSSHSD